MREATGTVNIESGANLRSAQAAAARQSGTGVKTRQQAAAEHRSIGGFLSAIKIKSENDKLSCFNHTVVGTAHRFFTVISLSLR